MLKKPEYGSKLEIWKKNFKRLFQRIEEWHANHPKFTISAAKNLNWLAGTKPTTQNIVSNEIATTMTHTHLLKHSM